MQPAPKARLWSRVWVATSTAARAPHGRTGQRHQQRRRHRQQLRVECARADADEGEAESDQSAHLVSARPFVSLSPSPFLSPSSALLRLLSTDEVVSSTGMRVHGERRARGERGQWLAPSGWLALRAAGSESGAAGREERRADSKSNSPAQTINTNNNNHNSHRHSSQIRINNLMRGVNGVAGSCIIDFEKSDKNLTVLFFLKC